MFEKKFGGKYLKYISDDDEDDDYDYCGYNDDGIITSSCARLNVELQ